MSKRLLTQPLYGIKSSVSENSSQARWGIGGFETIEANVQSAAFEKSRVTAARSTQIPTKLTLIPSVSYCVDISTLFESIDPYGE